MNWQYLFEEMLVDNPSKDLPINFLLESNIWYFYDQNFDALGNTINLTNLFCMSQEMDIGKNMGNQKVNCMIAFQDSSQNWIPTSKMKFLLSTLHSLYRCTLIIH